MASGLKLHHENVKDITVPEHKYYKCCIVPMCSSTTITAPNKLFFNVPKHEKVRKKWCLAIKRDLKKNPVSVKSTLHICEDHFNLMQDMENYMQYQLMGREVRNLRLKTGVIPHIFMCQQTLGQPKERHRSEKRRRFELVMEAEIEAAPPSLFSKYNEISIGVESVTLTLDKSVQVNLRPKYRNKATNT